MTLPSKIAITVQHHIMLQSHLFPADGLEAAAILVCNRAGQGSLRLCVEDIIVVPYGACRRRTKDYLSWPGEYIEEAIDRNVSNASSLILIHSHPGGFLGFSTIDDESDAQVIPCVFHGSDDPDVLHGSAIMTPDGAIKARLYNSSMEIFEIIQVVSVGSDIVDLAYTSQKPILAFSESMTAHLGKLTACVVGVSGTGSLVAEMLGRLGLGTLILIDFDHIEHKNLNRILNATVSDANSGVLKTKMMASAISTYRPRTEIITVERSISDPYAITVASDADILFSCVDSVEGRHYCDLISSAFILPLIDIGVTIPTRRNNIGGREIGDVCGRIDYVFPGGSSLTNRGVVTPEGLRREYLNQVAPDDLEKQIKAGYLRGVPEEAPSVISLNMRTASAGVNEWLARLFHFRIDPNKNFARTIFSLAACEEDHYSESSFEYISNQLLGRGLRAPLLGMPSLSERRREAS